jgi:hypothetical protein
MSANRLVDNSQPPSNRGHEFGTLGETLYQEHPCRMVSTRSSKRNKKYGAKNNLKKKN